MRYVLLVLALLMVVGPVPHGVANEGVGLQVAVDLEASTTSVKKVRSDVWMRYMTWIPIIGIVFAPFAMGPSTEVFEHSKGVTGIFLGRDVEGTLTVVEVRRGGAEFHPGFLRIKVGGSTLVLAFHGVTPRGYHVVALPGESSGAFAGLEVSGFLRVVGLSDRFSIVRGELVLGWPDRRSAASALVAAGWPEELVDDALRGSRQAVVPFPPADPQKPPQATAVRWLARSAGSQAADLSLVVLVGSDAMPVLEGGVRARSAKVRVVVAGPSGTTTLYEGEAAPGQQVTASGRTGLPAVVLVMVGTKTVFQRALSADGEP